MLSDVTILDSMVLYSEYCGLHVVLQHSGRISAFPGDHISRDTLATLPVTACLGLEYHLRVRAETD